MVKLDHGDAGLLRVSLDPGRQKDGLNGRGSQIAVTFSAGILDICILKERLVFLCIDIFDIHNVWMLHDDI